MFDHHSIQADLITLFWPASTTRCRCKTRPHSTTCARCMVCSTPPAVRPRQQRTLPTCLPMRKFMCFCFCFYSEYYLSLFITIHPIHHQRTFLHISHNVYSKKSREQELRVNTEMHRWAKEQLAELANPTNSSLEIASRAICEYTIFAT